MNANVNAKNIASGVILLTITAIGFYINLDYPVGTASRMGPGYMPLVVLVTLGGLSLGVLFTGIRGTPEGLGKWAWREMGLILAALAIFGVMLEHIGMAAATIALVVISGLADRTQTLKGIVALAVVLVALCWLIFTWGLQINVPFLPRFLANY
ncbi:hypothetical protein BCY90_18565 [Agrobacterium deltaense]|uniref:tripartite tricarboxylate transporter TctB family protein n=1 Tax=Agrobacterium TaxID=357 RepID=UPI000745A6BA|nr:MULTISPECIES: tripartite tricarboxylate transporter TctB family protein [Agrobacterium]KVK54021.1 hypothetical protein L901_19235 [Agrobacterium sp. D14]RKF40639.1 hypothetical protein BCY90_18565 [Agrobacterium deltaense]